jgi:DNA-directed RNA polymerase subunit M/transcription elongation factor TFIIS
MKAKQPLHFLFPLHAPAFKFKPMEPLSIRMLQERGASGFDAFVWAAQLKHADARALRVIPTAKHGSSFTNHAWMDRVLRAAAALDVGGKPLQSDAELATKTHHQELLDDAERDEMRIADLLSSAKKERAGGFLVCRNCRSTHVDVDQMQTRSADEPMTLFALCLDCGNRWTKK